MESAGGEWVARWRELQKRNSSKNGQKMSFVGQLSVVSRPLSVDSCGFGATSGGVAGGKIGVTGLMLLFQSVTIPRPFQEI